MTFEMLVTETLWLPLGLLAIVTAIFNIVFSVRRRNGEPWRFLSLSLTALTMCGFYSMDAHWVMETDWSALEDVTVTLAPICWILVVGSILLNGATLLLNKEK